MVDMITTMRQSPFSQKFLRCFAFLCSMWFSLLFVSLIYIWIHILQLFVSSLFLWKESQKSPPPKMTTDWRTVRLYPIPSIIYLIHNNVQFATLTYVDTSTYQIMGNLKIVTTGILFRWFSIKYKLLCSINTYHFWNSYSHTRADIFYFLI